MLIDNRDTLRSFGLLALVLAGMAFGAEPSPATAEPDALEVLRTHEHSGGIKEVLYSNGLRLLVKENFASSVVSLRVYVEIGSLYEDENLGSGISHYFEHIISGGSTSRRTEAENRAILKQIGNNSNAYTTSDHTGYFIITEAAHFEKAADLLGDTMGRCLIAPEEFEREQGVIVQEIRMNRDRPEREIHQLLMETMFPAHPAGQPVIGHLDLFQKIRRDQIKALYEKFYVANNMFVVVCGAVPAQQAVETIGQTFKGVKRGSSPLPILPVLPRQMKTRWTEKTSNKINRVYLMMGHHTISLDHPDLFALDLASDILSSGRTSRLYRALREKGLVESVYSYSHTPHYPAGVFGIGAKLKEENITAVLSSILEEINRLKTEPVDSREIARAVKERVTSSLFHLETADDIASDIGGSYLSARDPNFTERYHDGLRTVRPEDILRVATTYLTDTNRTLAILKPAAPAQVTEEKKADATTLTTTPVELITLENGVRLLYGYDPTVKSVLIQASLHGGVLREGAEENGVSTLMATLLMRGTVRREKKVFHEEMSALGAQISSGSGNNSWYAVIKVLKEDMKIGVDTLAEVILTPRFAEEDFLREQEVQITVIQGRNDSWQAESALLFRTNFFKNHPYSRPTEGTEESVKALTPAGVRAFHARTTTPENLVISLFGQVDRENAVKAVSEAFKAMPKTESKMDAPLPLRPAIEDATFTRANSKTQIVLNIGYDGPAFGHPDLPAMTVLDTLLSGFSYPSGRLHEALRGSADLVYFVHAWNWSGLNTGSFQIMTQTSEENLKQVLSLIDAEVARIRTEPVGEKELDQARESIVVSDAIDNESPGARAMQASYDELYGTGHDHHRNFSKRIRAVTAEDIKRVAGLYLGKRILTATGPASSLELLKPQK